MLRRFPRRRGHAGWAHTAHPARLRTLPTPHPKRGTGVAGGAHRGQKGIRRLPLVVALTAVLAACGPTAEAPNYPNLNSPAGSTTQAPPSTTSPGVDVTPTAVRIPSIGVDNNQMMQVGLNPDRSLEVPPYSAPNLIGWFKLGPLPGEKATCSFAAGCPGSSIMNAHINADGVQGAFAKLAQLKVGAVVEVDRSDDKVAVFKVTKVQILKKTVFPTKMVYGDTKDAELRLISCGPGEVVNGSYVNQTIIYAALTQLKPKTP
jgi:sortase (surface protein transpeptidase)